MPKIVGISAKSFTPKGGDGKEITGKNIFLCEPLDPRQGQGERAEKIFVSTAKLSGLDFKPSVGQEIAVHYNRYGSISTLELKSESDPNFGDLDIE